MADGVTGSPSEKLEVDVEVEKWRANGWPNAKREPFNPNSRRLTGGILLEGMSDEFFESVINPSTKPRSWASKWLGALLGHG
jgi:hypothetical protein